jgi:hypothetical protein
MVTVSQLFDISTVKISCAVILKRHSPALTVFQMWMMVSTTSIKVQNLLNHAQKSWEWFNMTAQVQEFYYVLQLSAINYHFKSQLSSDPEQPPYLIVETSEISLYWKKHFFIPHHKDKYTNNFNSKCHSTPVKIPFLRFMKFSKIS